MPKSKKRHPAPCPFGVNYQERPLYVQQIGRCTRPKDGKKSPVILDFTDGRAEVPQDSKKAKNADKHWEYIHKQY